MKRRAGSCSAPAPPARPSGAPAAYQRTVCLPDHRGERAYSFFAQPKLTPGRGSEERRQNRLGISLRAYSLPVNMTISTIE